VSILLTSFGKKRETAPIYKVSAVFLELLVFQKSEKASKPTCCP
jgi:hypothetical protein